MEEKKDRNTGNSAKRKVFSITTEIIETSYS